MEYGSPVGDFLSPESTVTTLLSSSGHLRSSLRPPDLNTTFRYKDKDYDSASAALDAYIADFDRSNLNGSVSTGKLVLQHGLPSTVRKNRASMLRNRDVLMESLTERELDFLDLPVSSLRHAGNRDRLSMTTDELLCIPNDGSMPVTHTSAFIHGLLSRSGSSQPHCSPSSPKRRACAGLSSSHINPRLNHQHPQHTRTPRSYRRGPQPATFKTLDDIFSESSFKSAHGAAGSEWAEPSSVLHHPQGFTGNKADMERPRMNCVPDLKYGPSVEAWIRGCDFSKGDFTGALPRADPRIRTPSWVADLEDDDSDLCSVVDSQLTLQDLRLQFAEQISLLAQERRSSDMKETLLRDNRIDSLIQKADRVLNSLSQSCDGRESSACPVSPVNTEELLLRSPSRSSSVGRDSALAAGGSTDALTETGAQTLGCSTHGNSIQKQPGPVEALKQMLFRLQAMEGKVQAQQQGDQGTPALTNQLHTEKIPAKQRTEGEAELESFSGGLSLHRALQHVSRLKLLVEEPTEKHREEGKDEGYSSSADRLICTQQKPS